MQSERERESRSEKEVENDLKALLDKISITKGVSLTESCVFLAHMLTSMIPIMTILELNANLEEERQASNIRPANLQNDIPPMRMAICRKENEGVSMESGPATYRRERNLDQKLAGKKSIQREGPSFEWKGTLTDLLWEEERSRSKKVIVKKNFADKKKPSTIADFNDIYVHLSKKTESATVVLKGLNEVAAAQLFSLVANVVERYIPITCEGDVEDVAWWLLTDFRCGSPIFEASEEYFTYLDLLDGSTASTAGKHHTFNTNSDTFCYGGVSGRPSAVKKNKAGVVVSVAMFIDRPTNSKEHIDTLLQQLYCCAWACRCLEGYLVIPAHTSSKTALFKSTKLVVSLNSDLNKELQVKFAIHRENQLNFANWIWWKGESVKYPSVRNLLTLAMSN